jgi:hypothetical protein
LIEAQQDKKKLHVVGKHFFIKYSPSNFPTLVTCFVTMEDDELLNCIIQLRTPGIESSNTTEVVDAIAKVAGRLGWEAVKSFVLKVSSKHFRI